MNSKGIVMSVMSLEPILPLPPPDPEDEDALLATRPVGEATAATSPRAVVPTELRDEQDVPPADAAELSNAGRDFGRAAIRDDRNAVVDAHAWPPPGMSDREALAAVDNPAVRELVRSFQNYDNSAAVEAYGNRLVGFSRYGAGAEPTTEATTELNLRAGMNSELEAWGLSQAPSVTREIREGISLAIDRWFVGEGVFMPQMLHFVSGDGFRFTPLSQAAMEANRAADILAEYDRGKTAAYLRRMAALKPEDFLFYDPTGLGALPLARRREFLAVANRILEQTRTDARAAELRYTFTQTGEPDWDALVPGVDNLENTLDRLVAEDGENYLGQLRNSVRQYGLDIISHAMA